MLAFNYRYSTAAVSCAAAGRSAHNSIYARLFARIGRIGRVAARRLSLFAIVAVASHVDAQSLAELDHLVFYPAPLPAVAQAAHRGQSDDSRFMLAVNGNNGVFELLPPSSVARYEQAVAAIELDEGPFAPSLFQNLLSLGLLHQQNADHEAALTAFERASAISRINHGLYAPEQITLVEHMITSLSATGQFDAVEDKHEFLVHLHRQYFGADTPETAYAMRGLGEWKLSALQKGMPHGDNGQTFITRDSSSLFPDYRLTSSRFDNLYGAQQTFLAAIRVLINNDAYADPALYQLEQDLITSYFINAQRHQMVTRSADLVSAKSNGVVGVRNRLQNQSIPEDYRNGQDAYLRQIGYYNRNLQATMPELADAILQLGDWHLMFGKYERADEQYRQLQTLLQKAQFDSQQIADILTPEIPVTLPAFMETAISTNALDDVSAYKGHVDIALTLNRFGRVSDISLLGSSSNTSENIEARLVSLVRSAQFRPTAGSGTESHIRYYYTY